MISNRANYTLVLLHRTLTKLPDQPESQGVSISNSICSRVQLNYMGPLSEQGHTLHTHQTKVQRRAARFITSHYRHESSVTFVLNQLKLQLLQADYYSISRRTNNRSNNCYRLQEIACNTELTEGLSYLEISPIARL